jgi:hypothetical protein
MGLNILLQCKSASSLGVADHSNLTPEEFQKLREYPLCPSRSDKKRMIVSQLYEPNYEFEKLELPIISWPVEVVSALIICSDDRTGVQFLRRHDSFMHSD